MTSTSSAALLLDRIAIEDTLYRYGACIDRRDYPGLRAVLADDVCARYGNRDPIVGGDAVVEWIAAATHDCVWQHHLLSVYSVEIEGDHANVLVYHTSYRGLAAEPTTARVLVGRYHGALRREGGGWRISDLVLEILWAERRRDSGGYLEEVGGRGPPLP